MKARGRTPYKGVSIESSATTPILGVPPEQAAAATAKVDPTVGQGYH